MKILIAAETSRRRQFLRRRLAESGYREYLSVEASHGKMALLEILDHRPDLVISDADLPEMSGIEVLRQVRSQGCGIGFLFVVNSSRAGLPIHEDSLAATISEPVDARLFGRLVTKLMASRQKHVYLPRLVKVEVPGGATSSVFEPVVNDVESPLSRVRLGRDPAPGANGLQQQISQLRRVIATQGMKLRSLRHVVVVPRIV